MDTKILLVDDDQDDRYLFSEALEELPLKTVCYTASNGREAILQMDERAFETPDIIFLDINMPIMNGWQCLTFLKEHETYKDIPVIMCSTSSYPEDVNKAQQLGAVWFFSKPHNFKDLKNNLEKVINHLTTDTLTTLTL